MFARTPFFILCLCLGLFAVALPLRPAHADPVYYTYGPSTNGVVNGGTSGYALDPIARYTRKHDYRGGGETVDRYTIKSRLERSYCRTVESGGLEGGYVVCRMRPASVALGSYNRGRVRWQEVRSLNPLPRGYAYEIRDGSLLMVSLRDNSIVDVVPLN